MPFGSSGSFGSSVTLYLKSARSFALPSRLSRYITKIRNTFDPTSQTIPSTATIDSESSIVQKMLESC